MPYTLSTNKKTGKVTLKIKATGEVLGVHDSREKALAQIRAVESSKKKRNEIV